MMLVHGFRLLVALITFVVGVGAGRLFGSESKPCGKRVYSHAPVHVAAPSFDAPPPPPRVALNVNYSRRFVGDGGLLDDKAVSKPAPLYPAGAQAAGVRGTVLVRVEVDESGRVATARAEGGPSMLREAAEDAARRARFAPTMLRGEPARVSGVITYNFAPR